MKKKLGEMLVEAGYINSDTLSDCIKRQGKSGLKLGQFLVRQGLVTEKQIVELVSAQLKIETYDPTKYPLDVSLSELIPQDIAKKYRAVPILRKGNLLTIAMDDPMDISAVDAIEIYANIEVEVVICPEKELDHLTAILYSAHSDIDEVMDQMGLEIGISSENQSDITDFQVNSLKDMAEEVPVIRLVNSILAQAVQDRASDIHLSPEKNHVQVRFRVDGKLQDVPSPPKNMFLSMISRLKIQAALDISVSRIPQDGRFTMRVQNREINVRVSTMPTIYGENMVMRLLDTSTEIFSLDQMGMSEADQIKIREMLNKPYGMILSSGPTGSGKSTTMYSLLKMMNHPDVNIITVEDPVEFRMAGIRQVQLNRKAGMTFATGLRAILRQDPDVIMVGEIRDSETAKISVQAAMTGHRVLSTVHTNDAAGAVTRFIDMDIEPFLVSSVMLASIGQRLIRKVCQHCKTPFTPPDSVIGHWDMDKTGDFVQAKGCYNCRQTGYAGRVGLFEVLVINEAIQEMILSRKSAQEISRAAVSQGNFLTLKQAAADKIRKGITTFEEAASAVMV
ncbi:MAG: GspE/PulE family protein [Proteobacteria bacterium]|nr:GspE/PulE family protein [Pseudomonadota bacterium]